MTDAEFYESYGITYEQWEARMNDEFDEALYKPVGKRGINNLSSKLLQKLIPPHLPPSVDTFFKMEEKK